MNRHDGPIEVGLANDIRHRLESIGYTCKDISTFYTYFIIYHKCKRICYVRLNIDNEFTYGTPAIYIDNINYDTRSTKFDIASPNLIEDIVNWVNLEFQELGSIKGCNPSPAAPRAV